MLGYYYSTRCLSILKKLTCWPVGRPTTKMAKASVKLTCKNCGKEFWAEKRNCYNRAEADRWEANMRDKGGLCTDCWNEEQKPIREAEKERMHTEAFDRAKRWEETVGIFPAIEGTEAQIKWATSIRHETLQYAIGSSGLKPIFFGDDWKDLVKEARKQGDGNEHTMDAVAYIRKEVFSLAKQKSAKWWIDKGRDLEGINAEYVLTHWNDINKIEEVKARRPKQPDCLTNAFNKSPEGATWNSKVYGSARHGNLCIYIADEKFPLTEKEAVELEKWMTAKAAWKKELEEAQKK